MRAGGVGPYVYALVAAALRPRGFRTVKVGLKAEQRRKDRHVNAVGFLNLVPHQEVVAAAVKFYAVLAGYFGQRLGQLALLLRRYVLPNLYTGARRKAVYPAPHLGVKGNEAGVAPPCVSLQAAAEGAEGAEMIIRVGQAGEEDWVIAPLNMIWRVAAGEQAENGNGLCRINHTGLENPGQTGNGKKKETPVPHGLDGGQVRQQRAEVLRPKNDARYLGWPQRNRYRAVIEGVVG